MHRLKIRDTLTDRILVTRESARLLAKRLPQGMAPLQGEPDALEPALEVDFQGVEGFAPSFFDELLAVIQQALGSDCRILLLDPPARFSRRFQLVLGSRGLRAVQTEGGSWRLEPVSRQGPPPSPSRNPSGSGLSQ